ncbi:MAG: YebC/PmpR family DNA-binding transcriptional regulator [Myxococcota bacterium]
MAGHNKWSKIKHKKGHADAKRSKLWTKLVREMTVAARLGGPDASANPRLRKAVLEAQRANMPKDNIARAIGRGSDPKQGDQYEELVYEGYGPGGVAVLVECLTDNRNRTISDVRVAFNKNNGQLGQSGCVQFEFRQEGQLLFEKSAQQPQLEDDLLQVGLEAAIDDVRAQEEDLLVTCPTQQFHTVLQTYEKAGFTPKQAQLARVAQNEIHLQGEQLKQLLILLNELEDLDDVQQVHSNATWNDSDAAKLWEG